MLQTSPDMVGKLETTIRRNNFALVPAWYIGVFVRVYVFLSDITTIVRYVGEEGEYMGNCPAEWK